MHNQRVIRILAYVWPPFWLVFAVSAFSLVAFVVWIYCDPWFSQIEMIRAGPPVPVLDPGAGTVEVASYDHLLPTFGRSVRALSALRWVALIATILVVIQLFIGRRSGRSIAAWLAATALLAAWLGLIVGYRRIRDDAFRSQARRQIPDLQQLADSLNHYRSGWPASEIETEFGQYVSDAKTFPNAVVRKSAWWDSDLPSVVFRLINGGLLFISPTNRFRFEWHPRGDEPSFEHLPNMSPLMKLDALTRAEPLGDGWFITEYEPIPEEWR